MINPKSILILILFKAAIINLVVECNLILSASQAKLNGSNADNLVTDNSDNSIFIALNGFIYKYFRDKKLDQIDYISLLNEDRSKFKNRLLTIIEDSDKNKYLLSCWQRVDKFAANCQLNHCSNLTKQHRLFWSKGRGEKFYTQISSLDLKLSILAQDNGIRNNLILATSRLDHIIHKSDNRDDTFLLPKVGIFILIKRNNSTDFVLFEQERYNSILEDKEEWEEENYYSINDNISTSLTLYEFIYSFNYKGSSYFLLNNIDLSHEENGINIRENNLTCRLLRITNLNFQQQEQNTENQFLINNNTTQYKINFHHDGPTFIELQLPLNHGESIKLASFSFIEGEPVLTIVFYDRSYLYPELKYFDSYNTPNIREVQLYSIGIEYTVYDFTIINNLFDKLHHDYKSINCSNPIITREETENLCNNSNDYNNRKVICKRKSNNKKSLEGFLEVCTDYIILKEDLEGDINFMYTKQQSDKSVIFSGAKDGYLYTYMLSLEQRRRVIWSNHDNNAGVKLYKTGQTSKLKTIIQTKNETKYIVSGNLMYYVEPDGVLYSIEIDSCHNYFYCDKCNEFKQPLGCVYCDNICSKEHECYSKDYSCPASLKLTEGDTYLIETNYLNLSLSKTYAFTLNNQNCVINVNNSIVTQLNSNQLIECKIMRDDYKKTIQFREEKVHNLLLEQNKQLISHQSTFTIYLYKTSKLSDNKDKLLKRELVSGLYCDFTKNYTYIINCKSNENIIQEKILTTSKTDDNLVNYTTSNTTTMFIMMITLILIIVTVSIMVIVICKKQKIQSMKRKEIQYRENKQDSDNQVGQLLSARRSSLDGNNILKGKLQLFETNKFATNSNNSNDYFESFDNFSGDKIEEERDYNFKDFFEIFPDKELYSKLVEKNIFIDLNRLKLGHELASGNFGKVFRGLLRRKDSEDYDDVAIKTLINRNWLNMREREAFLQEGLIMINFKHENVIPLIGISFDRAGQLLVITPLMLNGNLRSYLRDADFKPTLRILLNFAHQVAKGMEYLVGLKYVHRDLAARNCFLNDKLIIKIADFGLSRDIYDCDYVSENKQQARPLRWLSIESIELNIYNSKTDIWSYGVLLWEIMSCGMIPYPDVDNYSLLAHLKQGFRLEKPNICPQSIYNIMIKCWNENSNERPTFTELVCLLSLIVN